MLQQIFIEAVLDPQRPLKVKCKLSHSLEGGMRNALHEQQRFMHQHGRCLYHQTDAARQFHQFLQADQDNVGTKTRGKDTQIFHLRILLFGIFRSCQQRLTAVFQGKAVIVHGAVTVEREIKADGCRTKNLHLLGNTGLDIVLRTAGNSMDTQNHPPDLTEIRLCLLAEDL